MSTCRKCHCQIDRDDWSGESGCCGSCTRDMKNRGGHDSDNYAINNVCAKCSAMIPGNWSRCPQCGGDRKY
jgi:hypothetical protein